MQAFINLNDFPLSRMCREGRYFDWSGFLGFSTTAPTRKKKEGAVRVPILKTTQNVGYLANSLVLFRMMTIYLLLTNGAWSFFL